MFLEAGPLVYSGGIVMMCEVRKSLQRTSLLRKNIFGSLMHIYSTPIILYIYIYRDIAVLWFYLGLL